MQVLSSADIGDLNLFRRGKVRDTFQLADGTLLMIATDRLSAFDVVLPTPIPGKGTVLTQMSRWWFAETIGIMPNHLLPDMEEAIPEAVRDDWLPRSSVSPAVTSRVPDGRNIATMARSPARRCGKVCAIPRGCHRRDSPRRSRRTTATTSTSLASSCGASWGSR